MDIAVLEKCYEEIKANSQYDDTAEIKWESLLWQVIEYTVWRARWSLMSLKEKVDQDSDRTSCHNGVIRKMKDLSDYLDEKGVEHSWMKACGSDRKDIGDFANYIVFREAVSNR